MDQEPARQESR